MRLTHKIDLILTEDQEEWLDEISTFNINTRYDNYKQEFRNRYRIDYTADWIEKIETLRTWLINQL